MTEEDTFNALRKPTYAQMQHIWVTSDLISYGSTLPREEYLELLDVFFSKYGWDVEEYSSRWRELYE